MDCGTAGFHAHHQLPELTHTHVHWVSDAIQPSPPLSSPSPPAFNLSQHQGLLEAKENVEKWSRTQEEHHMTKPDFWEDVSLRHRLSRLKPGKESPRQAGMVGHPWGNRGAWLVVMPHALTGGAPQSSHSGLWLGGTCQLALLPLRW